MILLLIFISCGPISAAGRTELVVLYTNDFHGALLPAGNARVAPSPEKIGGAAYIAGKIREIRDRSPGPLLLVDSGDSTVGTSFSNSLYGIPVIDYMNHAGFEAMTLGNHEFEWGVGKLMAMREMAQFPFLAANLIDRRTGRVPNYAQAYAVVEKGGEKMGLIGLTSENATILQNPHRIRNLLFLSPEEPTRKAIEELHEKGIRIIFVLSHMGIDADRSLALSVSGISCIIGGHSHTVLAKPQKIGETVIVQAGSNGCYLGRLKLTLERETGAVLRHSGELIPIIDSKISPDQSVETLLMTYREKLSASMSEIIGRADEDLLSGPIGDSESTPLGNFITDALRITCKADVALYKSDDLQATILKGDIRKGDLYQVFPFDHKVIKATLTGKEIRGLLEFTVESPFLTQVSGLTITYDGTRKRGGRIDAILPDNKPMVDSARYCVATIDSLFYNYRGSGGFDVLKKEHRSEVFSREIVARYITKQKRIIASPECRVTKLPRANPASGGEKIR